MQQASRQASRQAGKHEEGIQSEPCPGGACSKNIVSNPIVNNLCMCLLCQPQSKELDFFSDFV